MITDSAGPFEHSLLRGFLASCERHPERPALEVAGETLTYAELKGKAAGLAATLQREGPSEDPPLTAVFAYRSVTAFAGVLAALMRGHGYVPLNRTLPPERTRSMLERSGCRAVVVDAASAEAMDDILRGVPEGMLILLPDAETTEPWAGRWPGHRFIGKAGLCRADDWQAGGEVDGRAVAYLLFTSGSTGQPKGVMVSHDNGRSYIDWTVRRYAITEEDRLSQTFDMTFDLSVHDMFVAWESGACLCCPSQKEMIKPGKFITGSRLTIWFSVPSTVIFMKRLGQLKPGAYPGLRLSLFCGEALPVAAVRDWAAAAPHSVIENIYGPTELTIACTAYRWDPDRSPADCEMDVVPIGRPFDGMEARVVDAEGRPVGPGQEGELLMTGPQLALGYWNDPRRTEQAFVRIPGDSRVFYRTGDRVRCPVGTKPMTYLGRMDTQVKILGHRVELGEVEAVLRQVTGCDAAVALAWPVSASGADGIEAFVQTAALDPDRVREAMRERLPSYMVPRNVRALERFPLNANGKFDRMALTRLLG